MSDADDKRTQVLAQPTRARLFELLRDRARPTGTDELATALGLHPSGVRLHLERMRAAGLVVRERAAQPRGRPRDKWRLSPEALEHAGRPDAYRQLARWLARSVPADPDRLAEVAATGRQLGQELAGQASADAVAATMETMLGQLGFAPALHRTGQRVTFELGRCPYREAVHENQPVVCTLHEGLTIGLLDKLSPASRLESFVPGDPDRAGCLIQIACAAAGSRGGADGR